ncbi:MAG: type VI secretion system membrane subunit TssM, partial [Neisseriaceae bacterium]|nr:type VI secretion system membrane subunit TssM [Neisseriaceae bacterium]
EVNDLLKKMKFSKDGQSIVSRAFNGQYLYQMPWYVLLGPAGSGKTTALENSGLHFPLADSLGMSFSGLAGTRDCDWFLSDEAVLLDTAGRFVSHNGDKARDERDWEEFLGLLQQYRPKQPVNGVVLTVSVADLLSDNADLLAKQAYDARKRIQEMRLKMGIDFPVYIMVTKLDVLSGFQEYFSFLDDEGRKQVFGFELPQAASEDSSQRLAAVAKEMQHLKANLDQQLYKVVGELPELAEKTTAFSFPEQFAQIQGQLNVFLKEVLKTSKYDPAINWRGVYFTSGTQTELSFNPVMDGFKSDLSLQDKYAHQGDGSVVARKNGYFLNALYQEVIFSEADLAGENHSWSKRKRMAYWAALSAMGLVGLAVSLLMINSYFNNKQYLGQVSVQTAALTDEFAALIEPPKLFNVLMYAQRIKDLANTADVANAQKPTLGYRYGLYQGYSINDVAEASYLRILQDQVMPTISQEVALSLREAEVAVDGEAYVYDALKAYLMMFNQSHFDADFMRGWLMKNIEIKNRQEITEDKLALFDQSLLALLKDKSIVPTVAYDVELVTLQQQAIARINLADLLYAQIKSVALRAAKTSDVSLVSFASMGGVQSQLVFRRVSGLPLKEPVSFLYTKEGYEQHLKPNIDAVIDAVYLDESWVLGDYASSNEMSKGEIKKDVERIYFNDYVTHWQQYVEDIRLITPKNLRESIQVAKLLSDKQSPLANIIRGISAQTSFGEANPVTDKLADKLTEGVLDRAANVISRNRVVSAVASSDDVRAAAAASIGANPVDLPLNIVPQHFAEFHALTDAEEGNPASIDNVVDAINDLYVYLFAVEMAINKGVDLPPEEPLVRYQAEINRLPFPFRGMLDGFVSEILVATTQLSNEKLLGELAAKAAPVRLSCQNLKSQGYPFIVNAKQDVSIKSFSDVFGPNGAYSKFLEGTDTGKKYAGNPELTISALFEKGSAFSSQFGFLYSANTLNKAFFQNSADEANISFTVRVIDLDPSIDSVSFSYDGQVYNYSHGPQVPMQFQWPAKDKNSIARIQVSGSDAGNKNAISEKGDWAIFRMLEQADRVNEVIAASNRVTAAYTFEGKRVLFEFISATPYNPFVLSRLRNFPC